LDRNSVERRRAGRAGFSLTNKAPTARSTARRRSRAPLCRWAVPAGEAPPPESTPHWILDCPGPRVDGLPSLGRGQGHAAVGNGARPPAPPLALGGPGAGPLTAYSFAASGFIQSGPASSRTRARRAALAVAGGSGLPLGDNTAGPAAPGGPAPDMPSGRPRQWPTGAPDRWPGLPL
jgi:hypothetical protein